MVDIVFGPVSQNVTLISSNFTCEAVGIGWIQFYINNTHISDCMDRGLYQLNIDANTSMLVVDLNKKSNNTDCFFVKLMILILLML